jgi:hypothetical protein
MHKTITKINKAAIIIIYHHGTNFVTLPKVKTRWCIGAYKLKIKEKGKGKIKLKLLLSLIFHWWLILIIMVSHLLFQRKLSA